MWPFTKKKQDKQQRVFGMRSDEALHHPEPMSQPDQVFGAKAFEIKQHDVGPYCIAEKDTVTPSVSWNDVDTGKIVACWKGDTMTGAHIGVDIVDSITTFAFRDALGYVNGFCLAIGKKKE